MTSALAEMLDDDDGRRLSFNNSLRSMRAADERGKPLAAIAVQFKTFSLVKTMRTSTPPLPSSRP